MTRAAQSDRMLVSAMADLRPFDWAAHNRRFDERMAEFQIFIERDAEIGRQIVAATNEMVAEVSAHLSAITAPERAAKGES